MKIYIRKRASEPVPRRLYCNILHDKIPSYTLDSHVSNACDISVCNGTYGADFYRDHRA